MSDALERAKEIAARLSGNLGLKKSTGEDSNESGEKRKRGWGDDGPVQTYGYSSSATSSSAPARALFEKKILIPPNPEVNYLGLLIGPKGANQKKMQDASGAKIMIRGKGSQKPNSEPTPHDQVKFFFNNNKYLLIFI